MALTLLAANNAQTVLAAGISSSATSITVNTGTGALFPAPASGASYFKLTLVDAATGSLTEIVHVTARSGDVMTIQRAQEGTVARAWSANDLVANMMTAGSYSILAQLDTPAFINATAGRLLNIQTLNASATYTKTPGTRKIKITITGGGASGGKSGVSGNYARGGGAGGTAIAWLDAPLSPVSVVIGAGGAGVNAAGNIGNPGGNSSYGSLITALGGTTTDGQGGSTTGEGITIVGGNGNSGAASSNNTFGGASYWGGGGSGYSAATTQALSGRAYGSGGAGVDMNASFSGNGAPGLCIIEEYA